MPSVCGSDPGSIPGIVAPVMRPPIETAASSPVTSATRRANVSASITDTCTVPWRLPFELRSSRKVGNTASGGPVSASGTRLETIAIRLAPSLRRSARSRRSRRGSSRARIAAATSGSWPTVSAISVGAFAQVADEVDGDGLAAREARVGLAGLVVADQVEQDEADARHRHDHDEHEERDELRPEAHAARLPSRAATARTPPVGGDCPAWTRGSGHRTTPRRGDHGRHGGRIGRRRADQ